MQASGLNEKELSRARNAAFRLLAYRPRSRAELEKKLSEKGFDEDIVRLTLSELGRLGYINDEKFSRQWAEGRIRLRNFGRRRIEQELRQKGISRDIILNTMKEVFGEAPEIDIARREAEKRLRVLGRLEPAVRLRRLAGHLERRGFSADVIREILVTIQRGRSKKPLRNP